MRNFKLESQNEFSKHFKSEDIDIYLARAYDDESKGHFVVANIPVIPEARTEHITYPMPFGTEEERDEFFKVFNEADCNDMIDTLINFMKEQTEFLNNEQKKIDGGEIIDTDYEITDEKEKDIPEEKPAQE